MAAVSLFWDTNVAAVTSCENTLYIFVLVMVFYTNFVSSIKVEPFIKKAMQQSIMYDMIRDAKLWRSKIWRLFLL